MNRVISVDWDELKTISNNFLEKTNELDEISKEFTNVIESMKSSWSGIDSDNFVNNCQNIITNLNNEISYLKVWSDYLSKSSNKYSENVETIIMRLQNINSDIESIE